MRKRIEIKKSQVFILMSLLALFALSAPHIIRHLDSQPLLIGDEPYYHARLARQTLDEGLLQRDDFVHGGRPYTPHPYHLLLAAFSALFGVVAVSKIIPIICGLVSAPLFYLILKRLGFSQLNRITISCVFLLSPVFIYMFSLSTPFCIMILLDLLGFFLFLQKEKRFYIASVAVFVAASFFGILNLLMVAVLALSYTLAHRKKIKRFYMLALFLAAVLLFYYLNIYFKY
jgi:hypothetical protein